MENYFIHEYFFHIVAYILVSLIFMFTENKWGFPTATAAALLYYIAYNRRQDKEIVQELAIGGWEKVRWRHRIKYNKCPDDFAWFWPLWIAMVILFSLLVLMFDIKQKD